jgi:hypothetical protein
MKRIMRYLIISLLFFTANCSGHQSPNPNLQTDTARLFDPKPEADHLVENILNHCLMLEKDNIAIVLNDKKYRMGNSIELSEFLQHNSLIIDKQKFYIVYANDISTKRIIEIIDIVKAAKIENYKAVKLESLFILNEPK